MDAPRLLIDALAARFGGTAFAAVQTARQFARSQSFSEVVVFARRGSIVADGLSSTEGVRLHLLPSAVRGELVRRVAWEALSLPREVSRRPPAVVMSWSGMVPRRVPAPVISLVSNPLMFEGAGLANWLRRQATQRTATEDARVVAPTKAMAALANKALGVPAEVVPWGVDHDRFSPVDQVGDEILCVADFYQHKRHDLVLDAWAKLPSPRPTLRLVGDARVDPAAYRKVLARVQRYSAWGAIQLDHRLSLSELVAVYRRARVFVIASEHEAFCMPLLEALACGIPAVARDLPALRETGGVATRFVGGDSAHDWASQLARVVGDDQSYRSARTKGLEHAKAFSWRRTADELERRMRGSRGGETRPFARSL